MTANTPVDVRCEVAPCLATRGHAHSMIDLTGNDPSWTIAGKRAKSGGMHRVPLTPLAVEVFRAAVADTETDERSKKFSKTPFVFPGRGTTEAAIDPHAVTRAMSRLMAALGIENATVHDLRRTVGSNLARMGVSKDIRARVLNHVDGARSVTDAVYNQHEFLAEKRAALTLWEAELRRIVGEALVGLATSPEIMSAAAAV